LDSRFALPTGTVLDGAYRIVRVVGTGGFGITYEAEDIALRTTVALKEYFPDEFGDRDARMSVRPKSERHKQTFEWGRSNFLKEARTLARFEHPSIVRVSRVFEAHSTAYMVMSFERGQSLEAWLRGLDRPPSQDELDRIAAPLLDALQLMHAADFLHRDIAPDNIIVRADGSPVLLDFGASRRAVAETSRAMTGIVKAGYSPHEQYASDGRLQGPWSDLYALGGTLYRAVTGGPPEEATLRVDADHMAPAALAAKGSYRPGFLAGIDACLAVRHANRPRSVAQLRPMLFAPAPVAAVPVVRAPQTPSQPPKSPRAAEPAPASPARRWVAVAAAMLVIAAGAYAGYEFTRWQRLQHEGAAADARTPQTAAQKAELDAQRRRQQEADTAQRQATLDAERQRKEAAEAVARADAERRRQQEERAAAEAEARRKAQTEAEETRKVEEERRRIASREDPSTKAPVPPPGSSEPARPPGRLIKMRAKVGSLPNDARKGWLGFSMEPLELPLALALGLPNADGALVVDALAGSPAAHSGIRFGDVVIGLNARPVASTTELLQRLSSMAPGSEAALEVWRVGNDAGDFVATLRRLADGGNAHVMYRLGRMYAAGLGVARDEVEAVRWYRRGADAGNVDAVAALAVALLDGRGAAMDRQEGLRLLKAAAADNHAESMNRLGHLLLDGSVVDKDAPEAVRWFTKAAEAGHAPSMVDLGRLNANGIGAPADPAKAAMWFRQAADLGNANAMAGLGLLYQQGKGVEADLAKAVMWYKRGADLGSVVAMTDLAVLYIQGKGVEKNDAAAAALYRKAAGLGSSIAMNNLAWMLQGGKGVARKDPDEAADLMLKALDLRNEFSLKQMTQSSRTWSKEFRQAFQGKLRKVGFFTGPSDGEFRDSTITAINAYFNRSR
jgi:TPR repeat protein/tRNA A-37 threonylcarbamoyl transferase component Bud32